MVRPRRARLALVLAAAGMAAALAAATAVPAAAAPAQPAFGPGAFAWGSGQYGQLGDGGTADQARPVLVVGLPARVVQVAAGAQTSAALLSDGTVWVWGCYNCPSSVTLAPQQVPGLPAITQIAVSSDGGDFYAVAADGTLWAWGANSFGQLGNGNTTDSATPALVSGLTGVTQVSAGSGYALALRSDGTVWAWGDDSSDQLGEVAQSANTELPQLVHDVSRIIEVSAYWATSYAVSSDGVVFTWGSGTVLWAVVQGVARVVQVASDGYSTLALTSDGHVFAWGSNSYGELGDGTTTDQSYPEQIGLSGIIQVAIAHGHSAAVSYNGTLWTWGGNPTGELGNGTCCTDSPVPAQVPSLAGVSQVALGGYHDLAVGSSYNYATVPSLTGDTPAQASQALQAAGLVIGTVRTVVDYTCNNIGTVINQSPAAGSIVSVGSAVTVTIGTRPPRPCT